MATSAIRFYEARGLVRSRRTTGNQRRYEQAELRRVAFIRTAQRVGLSLDEIARGAGHAARGPHADQGRLDPAQPRLAAAARRADPPDRAAARPARQLHRLRLPQPAHLRAAQPRRRRGRRAARARSSSSRDRHGRRPLASSHGPADRGEPPGPGDRVAALGHSAGGVDRRLRRPAPPRPVPPRRADRPARRPHVRRQGDRRGDRVPRVPPAARPAADRPAGGACRRAWSPAGSTSTARSCRPRC